MAFNRHDPTCGQAIRSYTKDNLCFALDCITLDNSTAICYHALGSKGGRYVSLNPFPIRQHTRRDVKPSYITEPAGSASRPSEAIRARFYETWVPRVEAWVRNGEILTHPARRGNGGLEGILGGLALIRQGEVSAEKVVFNVVDPTT